MLFGQDRDRIRRFWCQAWADHLAGRPLEPLQQQIVAVIGQHPEYRQLLEDEEHACSRDYPPEAGETNPFLHMGMHLAIREQFATDRPAGMRALHAQLLARFGDSHALEHRLMECLAESIWQAQRQGGLPDEQAYLDCVRSIAGEDE